MYNEVAENVLGALGAVLWSVQLIPQIVRNYKVKDCTGLPPLMMFLWAVSGVPFSIYFLGIDGSIPLRIQPQLFTFFCLITWFQTLYYPPHHVSRKKLLLCISAFVLVSVGLELGLVFGLRPLHRRGITWPMLIIGVIASVLLALGLIPPYFELGKRKGRVIGINFIFLSMDSLGAIVSMLSVIVGKMDVMSCVLYAVVLALELGIFTSHIIWYVRFGRKMTKEELELDLVSEKSRVNDIEKSIEAEETDTGANEDTSLEGVEVVEDEVTEDPLLQSKTESKSSNEIE
ncbi:uncharacterized protein KGF55_004204 [Candida pseudojiufengensis]|uniref:uncharacterized protein n=1 Tax=Candida pseudojiufengensis TaxID=497109 RepID=UPI002224590B|nr:uncharacterized protein KGF55_004204 [Candida pseudojiufengensis]KAI5960937.1 hypothetical protein KGF55_004204 [Candida pseudojiufengensis]